MQVRQIYEFVGGRFIVQRNEKNEFLEVPYS
jgi:hypothetical protein